MKDKNKTRVQLIKELDGLRKKNKALKIAEATLNNIIRATPSAIEEKVMSLTNLWPK